MKILFVCHKPIYTNSPRGAEKSVRAIVEYLQDKNHDVTAVAAIPGGNMISRFDVVATWGRPAQQVAEVCREARRPLLLMVRFWKNVAPPLSTGYGNLMQRNVTPWRKSVFDYASAIATNSIYARTVIHRWQPASKGKTHVSYVPIRGEFSQLGNKDGHLLIVTPEVYGERWLVGHLAKRLPNEKFHVINCDEWNKGFFSSMGPNVTATGYANMAKVWRNTKALLLPIYNNDICGTRRVTIEAFRHGIPVIALDRCGVGEKIPPSMLISYNAKMPSWITKIQEVNRQYERFQDRARRAWEKYDTDKELEEFEKILLSCVN